MLGYSNREAIMESILSNFGGQQRALTMRSLARGILARTGVLVLCGVTFASVTVEADDDIVVPRDFSTIQAAVDAAAPGATIKVSRGTYTEEIVITKDLNLKGDGIRATQLQSPSALTPFAVFVPTEAPVAAVVLITNGAEVRISGFTLTGPVPCDVEAGGIAVVEGARLRLEESQVTWIQPEPADPSTCSPGSPAGAGIRIGLTATFSIDTHMGSTGHGKITGVTVDRYLGAGIVVGGPPDGATSTATISNNVIRGGSVPFPVAGQGGIAIRQNSVARVTENTFSGNVCTDPFCGPDPINEFQSAGIAAIDLRTSGNEISDNRVSNNDTGIYQFASPHCCTISENRIKNNRFFGIVIQDGDGTASENDITSGQVGIGVVADAEDTTAVLKENEIRRTSVAPVQELECCGFNATAIVEDD
jgi:parallel beta-helix repeat protein